MANDHATAHSTAQADAAYFDFFTNTVPVEYWLPESQEKKPRDQKVSPLAIKSTSQLLLTALRGQQSQRPKQKGPSLSREELRAKLHSKIDELKDKQKKEQSERDKAAKVETSPKGPTPEKVAKQELRARLKSQIGELEAKRGKEPKAEKRSLDVGHVQVGQRPSELTVSEAGPSAPGSKKRKLQQLLQKEAEEKRKIDQIDAKDRPAAKHAADMQKALQRASGEKVYDQSAKLKKALKAISVKKAKSKQSWTERTEHVQKEMTETAEKRNENLKSKRARGKHEGKKGESKQRAGFEGKRKGFLNSM